MTVLALPDRLQARLELEDFYADYVACLDEGRIEEWPGFFTEDALYRLVSRENWEAGLPISMFLCRNRRQIQDRVTSYREANIYPDQWNRHFVSGVQLLEVDAGLIRARSNYLVVQTRQDGVTNVYQTGRSHDELICSEEGWKLRSRELIYDTHAVATLFVMPI